MFIRSCLVLKYNLHDTGKTSVKFKCSGKVTPLLLLTAVLFMLCCLVGSVCSQPDPLVVQSHCKPSQTSLTPSADFTDIYGGPEVLSVICASGPP